MPWPTPQDYNEAIQNPHLNFSDAELQQAEVELSPLGLPRVTSGAFASVYKMRCCNRDIAVRCFLHNVSDQYQRYGEISSYVMTDDLPYTVGFEYVEKGIRVQGNWYPILKMEWVPGESLDSYVKRMLKEPARLAVLAEHFKRMLCDLKKAGIAHGDLQHGNIMILKTDELRLVDYDGMFVPGLSGYTSNELGHRNYQHPSRSLHDFGPYLDNFSAWSIYTSLMCLSKDMTLIDRTGGGDECLLFKQADYKKPLVSKAFKVLESHESEHIRDAARQFRALLSLAPNAVPFVDEELGRPEGLPDLNASELFAVDANLPDWLKEDTPVVPGFSNAITGEILDEHSRIIPSLPQGMWPSLTHYMRAIRSPAACFADEELRRCRPHVDSDNKILAWVGARGVVFRLDAPLRSYAIKVFFKHDPERAMRYTQLHEYTKKAQLEGVAQYLVPCSYQDDGIKIHGEWFPVLKMPWLDGWTLNEIIRDTESSARLEAAAHQLKDMISVFRHNHFVHGDLDADNIMCTIQGLKIVDYDLIQAPGMSVGKGQFTDRKISHPLAKDEVSADVDNFAAWVLDTGLVSIRQEPWLSQYAPRGQFLLTNSDFVSPEASHVLNQMKASAMPTTRNRARLLSLFSHLPLAEIPALHSNVTISAAFDDTHALKLPRVTATQVCPDVGTAIDLRPTLPARRQQSTAATLVSGGAGLGLLFMAYLAFMAGIYPICVLFGILAALIMRFERPSQP